MATRKTKAGTGRGRSPATRRKEARPSAAAGATRRRGGKGHRLLCERLAPFLAQATAAGNDVVSERWEPSLSKLAVALRRPASEADLRGALAVRPPVEEQEAVGAFRLYCDACGDVLFAPKPPVEPVLDETLAAATIRAVLDAERARGNPVRTFSTGWSACPLAVTLAAPLDFAALTRAGCAAALERFESLGPHGPPEAGLRCAASRQNVSGPHPLFARLRPVLEPVVADLVAGRWDDVARRCAKGLTAVTLRAGVRRRGERLVTPRAEAWDPPRGGLGIEIAGLGDGPA